MLYKNAVFINGFWIAFLSSDPGVYRLKLMARCLTCGFTRSLRCPVVLVDHAAGHRPPPNWQVQRNAPPARYRKHRRRSRPRRCRRYTRSAGAPARPQLAPQQRRSAACHLSALDAGRRGRADHAPAPSADHQARRCPDLARPPANPTPIGGAPPGGPCGNPAGHRPASQPGSAAARVAAGPGMTATQPDQECERHGPCSPSSGSFRTQRKSSDPTGLPVRQPMRSMPRSQHVDRGCAAVGKHRR